MYFWYVYHFIHTLLHLNASFLLIAPLTFCFSSFDSNSIPYFLFFNFHCCIISFYLIDRFFLCYRCYQCDFFAPTNLLILISVIFIQNNMEITVVLFFESFVSCFFFVFDRFSLRSLYFDTLESIVGETGNFSKNQK